MLYKLYIAMETRYFEVADKNSNPSNVYHYSQVYLEHEMLFKYLEAHYTSEERKRERKERENVTHHSPQAPVDKTYSKSEDAIVLIKATPS